MTARIVTITAIALALSSAQAVDINKLPPMDDYGWKEAGKLNGRDVEAVDAALRQFREDHFSTSGDLKHFTVELRRHGDTLAVAFFPEYIERHLIHAREKQIRCLHHLLRIAKTTCENCWLPLRA